MHRSIPFSLALTPLLVAVASLILSIFVLKLPLFIGLLAGTITALLIAWRYGYKRAELMHAVVSGAKSTGNVVIILLIIGVLVPTWLNSGTVAGLVYYGLKLVSAKYFLISAFLLTTVTSMILGTALGTLSTMGVALLGIGFSLGFPKPLVAGAIISGAFFGDRSSPMSSAANLAASATGSDFHTMLRHMLPTGLAGLILSAIGYVFLGGSHPALLTTDSSQTLSSALNHFYVINPLVLLAPIIVIALALKKLPTAYTLGIGLVTGSFLALFLQKTSLFAWLTAMLYGYQAHSANPTLNAVFKGGGLVPMLSLVILILSAGAFNGIISATGMIGQIAAKLLKRIKTPAGVVTATVMFSGATAMVVCNQALPILLPGQMLTPLYQSRGLKQETLARTLTDSGLMLAGLIPWNMLAVLSSATIGVPTLQYAPYALLLWLLPIITLAVAWLNDKTPVGRSPLGLTWLK
ncbi:MAG TPA: Na+/H+ antiporter NhaC family protein [Desulfobacteria bacterium]|nr:Na+/H+ antiporter NhaC family protein [Desulfobacteria bacterium]